MRIRQLWLENVGPYEGVATMKFSVDPARPITLVGGRNGAGKTTLLNAIPLVLYGNRAKSMFGSSAFPEYLNRLVHSGKPHASVSLEFDRRERGQTVCYRVCRKWSYSRHGKAIESLSIYVDGESRTDLESIWPEYVDGILPFSVSGLSIFDGEKIEKLADASTSAEVLKACLHGLLGLDLIDRLDEDLSSFRRKIAPQIAGADTSLKQKVEQAESLIHEQTAVVRDLEAQLVALLEKESEASAELSESKLRLQSASGDLFNSREKLHADKSAAVSDLQSAERQLELLVTRELPLLMLRPLLSRVVEMGDRRQLAEETALLMARMKERDERLIEHLREQPLLLPEGAIDEVEAFLRSDRASYDAAHHVVFDVTPMATEQAKELLGSLGIEVAEEAFRLREQLFKAADRVEAAHRTIELVPSSEAVSDLLVSVAESESRLALVQSQRSETEQLLSDAKRMLSSMTSELERLASDLIESGARDSDAFRVIREADAARKTLRQFSSRIVNRHIGRISDEIAVALTSLLRKERLVTRVTIDTETFDLALFGRNGERLDAERLSAGERQMVATATLWGLAKSTGRTLPAIIDTPVGRLDHSHRSNLVEGYFPHAAQQVVLLSTDEELVGSHLEKLESFVGASYLLEYDDENDATEIREGYFI